MSDLEQWIERKLEAYSPSNRAKACFAYFGDLPLGETYGSAFGQHRDSDALDRSNFRVITADMIARFPDDCEIGRASHWLVGWHETLYIRLRNEDGTPTEAAQAALEWEEKLESYLIADESDWYELETEEQEESWEQWVRGEFAEEVGKRFDPVDLDLPTAFLDSIRERGEEAGHYIERNGEGGRFPLKEWADLVTVDEVVQYGSEEDWTEYDRLADLELPPYLRDSSMPEGWGRP